MHPFLSHPPLAVSAIPEPTTLALLAIGLAGISLQWRSKRPT
ncbi:MAG: PEP-CTERM sorting domain-containing protein [Gammaproteobacteria bacterium]|nr:PEP-CTERM sorting domain-containing protein [Gammaproteobacteria bacterium]